MTPRNERSTGPDAVETRNETRNSTLWTVALATALLGLVALPRRTGRSSPAPAMPGDPTRQPSPSHTGSDAKRVAANEPERGRGARKPSEIPAKGWKDIGLRVFHDISENNIVSVAAGVTFYVLLAIFPAIAALVSCYGLVADVATINDQLASLQGVVPSGALEIIGEQVKRIAAKGDTTLGLTFFTGIVLSVWSANGGMKAVFSALNIVYEERERRSFVWLNLRSLTFTAGALLFIILALIGIVVVPAAINILGLSAHAWYIALLRWPVLLVAVLGGLALLYRYGPSRDAPRWRWVTWGSAVAAVGWVATSLGFSWYVANFGKYNETYGSLGAVIGFMTWIWISTTIVLLGAEINAEMEHQTEADTTRGPEQPLGTRDARMADTVGAAT
ncbi:YihY/virulence factor BrkB family protein [Methylobacterium sp. J-078]|uniref:YihY/virulence factor BrkB family protein n=1 Tax=Methylobacterium sp. J-078 TaxID=2836657 RepID=UPI001FBB3F7B|nr:YihY/virulence factor BrkB family protein [Methylobacterium sp. J-078]MCJ2046600.1 YihY/virulence factor BrkB family protein [Methylobacterium sp. J-078]